MSTVLMFLFSIEYNVYKFSEGVNENNPKTKKKKTQLNVLDVSGCTYSQNKIRQHSGTQDTQGRPERTRLIVSI